MIWYNQLWKGTVHAAECQRHIVFKRMIIWHFIIIGYNSQCFSTQDSSIPQQVAGLMISLIESLYISGQNNLWINEVKTELLAVVWWGNVWVTQWWRELYLGWLDLIDGAGEFSHLPPTQHFYHCHRWYSCAALPKYTPHFSCQYHYYNKYQPYLPLLLCSAISPSPTTTTISKVLEESAFASCANAHQKTEDIPLGNGLGPGPARGAFKGTKTDPTTDIRAGVSDCKQQH